ncbi:hypothetical protein GCM10009817_39810 [Terrabacter lapilli]|uniref:Uncharacterized protein n=1 Tax=Terrabacter lapilli TaxID=436231 RepID=A0ABN2SW34_9MICO
MTQQPDHYQSYQPTTGATAAPPPPPAPPKKKKRIFMWVFLAVQAIFLLWIIAGANSASSTPCTGGLSKENCDAATAVGTGIGVMLIVGLWAVVDFFMVIIWAVVRLSSRNR